MIGQQLVTSLDIEEPTIDNRCKVQQLNLKSHISGIAPNCFMITHSARQNRPSLRVLADLDARLLFRLGKMGASSFETVKPLDDSTCNKSFSFSSQIVLLLPEGS
jgi:hypothetical protein